MPTCKWLLLIFVSKINLHRYAQVLSVFVVPDLQSTLVFIASGHTLIQILYLSPNSIKGTVK